MAALIFREECNLEKEGGREAGGAGGILIDAELESGPGLLAAAAAEAGAQFWFEFAAKAVAGLELPLGGFGDVGEGVSGAVRSGCDVLSW